MSDKYYVISNSDGDTYVSELEREELIDRLNRNYYGQIPAWIDQLKTSDTNYWNGCLIIKGEIVTPKAKKIVEKYEI